MNNFFDFQKYINELEKRVKYSQSEEDEFEIRFGEFKIKKDSSGNIERDDRGRVKRFFDSTFKTESFYTLKKMLDNQSSIKKYIKNTIDEIYKMDNGFNGRKTMDQNDNSEQYIKKKSISQ